jgi:enamine deaminase RidA (YjgF/YER057c/UK114 family)
MSERAEKLEKLGYALDKVPSPAAAYRPIRLDGNLAYCSGALPFDGPGNLICKGKVPLEVALDEAKRAAALCAANLLRVLNAELGNLERIERVLKLNGFVASAPEFTDQHLVINGASELFVAVLGDAGAHARSALGVAALPLGAAVEVDLVVRVHP